MEDGRSSLGVSGDVTWVKRLIGVEDAPITLITHSVTKKTRQDSINFVTDRHNHVTRHDVTRKQKRQLLRTESLPSKKRKELKQFEKDARSSS